MTVFTLLDHADSKSDDSHTLNLEHFLQNSKRPPKCNIRSEVILIYHIGMCDLWFLGDLASINSFLGFSR